MTEIDNAINQQVDKLENIVSLLETFTPTSRKFTISIDNPVWIEFDTAVKDGKQFIYIIRISQGDKESILEAFTTFKKKSKGKYRLSSINTENNFTQVLYVGTSALGPRSLSTRMRQHVGVIGPMVYSLQMEKWCLTITKEIEVEVFPIDQPFTGALYAFENALWDYFSPLFGKKGVNVNTSSKL